MDATHELMSATRASALALLCAFAACGSSARPPPQRPAAGAERAAHCAPSRVELRDLLEELSALDALTRMPCPGFTAHLASSFDPRSRDAAPGSEAWFANRDFAERPADGTFVLLDVHGPGVVTRMWSANPSGTLRVFIDGAEQPAIEADMRGLLRGEVAPFERPLAFEAGRGFNLYFPIAFQSRCRITVQDGGERLYFQVNHRRYPEGTAVEPFSATGIAAAADAIAAAAAQLRAPVASPRTGETSQRFTLASRPDRKQTSEVTLAAPAGGGVVRGLRAAISPTDPAALRETLLSNRADGEPTVAVPIADFFRGAPGHPRARRVAYTTEPETWTFESRWPMPFRERLTIALVATSDRALEGHFAIDLAPHVWDGASLHFHAAYHPPDLRQSEPTHDVRLAELHGQGTLAGVALNVINESPSWWGEGDEKIWIDDAPFPTHFGTGTEDYFGYAYCSNEPFTTPFIGQPRVGARQNFGAISLYRVHALDRIPFARALRFDLEVNHWGDEPVRMVYDAIVFFYARPGARAEPSAADRTAYRVPAIQAAEPLDIPAAPYRCGG